MSKKSKYIANLNGLAINYAIKPRAGKRNREWEKKRYAEQKAKLVEGRKIELYMLICDVETAVCELIESSKFGDLSYSKLRNRLKKLLEILRGAE